MRNNIEKMFLYGKTEIINIGISGDMMNDKLVIVSLSVLLILTLEMYVLEAQDPPMDGSSHIKLQAGPTVNVCNNYICGNPPSTWTDQDQTAMIQCTDGSGCDANSYYIIAFDPDEVPASCAPPSGNYETYYQSLYSGGNARYLVEGGSQMTIDHHLFVCAAARNTLDEPGYSSITEFLVDQEPPTSYVIELPEWLGASTECGTYPQAFLVQWIGQDHPLDNSGIAGYTVEYNETHVGEPPSGESDWQSWLTWYAGTQHCFGPTSPDDVEDNRTYYFRVRAQDIVSNEEAVHSSPGDTGVSIDLTPPVCSISIKDLYNEFVNASNQPFAVNWSASDGESGIDHYNIAERKNSSVGQCYGEPNSWVITEYEDYETSKEIPGWDTCMIHFMCNATDVAGNSGAWSPIVNTTVDLSNPTDFVISEPLTEWNNSKNGIILKWSGFDNTSGIFCYNVEWTDDDLSGSPVWNYITDSLGNPLTDCNPVTEAAFRDNPALTTQENVTYHFRIWAEDVAGNIGDIVAPPEPDSYNVTFDWGKPNATVQVFDQLNNLIIKKVVSALEVTSVSLVSSAVDNVSGIDRNIITYDIVQGDIRDINDFSCGQAPAYGGESRCSIGHGYAEDVVIKYQVFTKDRAGNLNSTPVMYITTHPVANWMANNLRVLMGDSYIVQMQVRNLDSQYRNASIMFFGYGYATFVDAGYGDNYELQSNNKRLVLGLNPDEDRIVQVKVESTGPTTEYLYLNATLINKWDMNDTDDILVSVAFPTAFPGLDDIAVFVLITLAGFVYFIAKKRNLF
jgi:hypothetical protein